MLDLRLGDCLNVMKSMPSASVDLTVTSPPYDNLRRYNGFTFDFEGIAQELYRVTKDGGVVVWIVGDATIKVSESGTSFRQALYFMECGFNLHDTMIWNKKVFSDVGSLKSRYAPVFEYMFILSKGKLKSFNPIKDRKNKHSGKIYGTIRQKDGTTKAMSSNGKLKNEFWQRFNVWEQYPCMGNKTGHPAPFPEQLAHDHIISWSNESDTVLDCFMGSGTTGKMAKQLNRNFIGIEISQEYLDIAKERIGYEMD